MPDDEQPRSIRFRSYSPRIEVHEDARLIDAAGKTFHVVLADISREGFRIKHDGAAVRPGPATLQVERYGDMPVEVKWVRAREAGGIFLDDAPDIF
jgi:hypothetical protein